MSEEESLVRAGQDWERMREKEVVDHPAHYNQIPGIECIDVIEHFSYPIGVVIKHLWRAGLKGEAMEDLKKAQWYLNREIERRERDTGTD
jgi:hypothetical protein